MKDDKATFICNQNHFIKMSNKEYKESQMKAE